MTQQEFRLLEQGDLATGQIRHWHITGYQILDRHIATGEVKARALFKDQGSGVVDDSAAGTEFAHSLGVTPVILTLVPTTQGVMGYVQEKARSATSITLKANVSGVHVKYTLLG